jgi:hypothetical protein
MFTFFILILEPCDPANFNLLENSLVTIFFIVSLSTSNSLCKELAKIISFFGKLFKYCLKLFNFFSSILYLPINLEGLMHIPVSRHCLLYLI